jgi:ATP-dependent 26S proteasome regulatory subunit
MYRNQSIRIVFEPGPPNRFGEQDLDRGMNLRFLQERTIDEESIVLDDLTRTVLEHTVVDFHRRREQLMALGLPGKRGVLFYGPPGTGKTYTSAYLGQRLHDATKIIVAGKSLLRMADVCAIATSLQPALVILEDVDLVFSDRELAPSTTLLGEFLDQLDGFANNDQIIFILTTNVLERVEAAIKDRPGRVSQCIFFGPPSAELRRRYLESQTRRFETSQVHFDRVVAQTDGGSQAFLKELILRAVQIASVRPYSEGRVVLTDTDFELAVREMTTAGGKLGKRIIGFQIE